MFRSEHEIRQEGTWEEPGQTVVETICPYCGVGCDLELHVQDNAIVKVTSPLDHDITRGHLCIKGRFGFEFVQNREPAPPEAERRPRRTPIPSPASFWPGGVPPGSAGTNCGSPIGARRSCTTLWSGCRTCVSR